MSGVVAYEPFAEEKGDMGGAVSLLSEERREMCACCILSETWSTEDMVVVV